MAEHVCPVWVGYILASPLRRFIHNPDKILGPYVKQGMKVLDFGCAMGFFSLPLAKMVGSKGQVICVDMQEKMILSLNKRASKQGLSNIIKPRVCYRESFNIDDIKEEIDFALLFYLIHEVPDTEKLIHDVYKSMKKDGKLLITEPKGHVSNDDFNKTISIAKGKGFNLVDQPKIIKSRTVLLCK